MDDEIGESRKKIVSTLTKPFDKMNGKFFPDRTRSLLLLLLLFQVQSFKVHRRSLIPSFIIESQKKITNIKSYK